MNAFTGTLQLVRLALRLDRFKLPLWILLTVGLIALTLPQLTQAYGSEAQRLQYAAVTAPSVVTRLLGGALTGPSMGEISVVETFLLAALMIALLNIFLVTRHTRKNEETGRGELIGSMAVGRQAMLTSALILALAVNIICGVLITWCLLNNGLPFEGSMAYAAGLSLLGLVFAGVAAAMAQMFETTRAANSAASLVFGLAFAIRGVGDALGTLQPGGFGVTTAALSYFSPLGWVTNIKPFSASGEQWGLLALLAGTAIALIFVAYVLLARRDFGGSLVSARPGRMYAKPTLLRPFGLVWRLNRTSLIAWLLALGAMGATTGAVAKEFESLIAGNEEMQKLLAQVGGGKEPSDIMFGAMFAIIGIALSAYCLQVLIRMHSEENSGRLGLYLSTAYSRIRWAGIYVMYTVATAVIILFVSGLATGITYGLINGSLASSLFRLGGSIMVYMPAVTIIVGLAVVLFGALPRFFVPAAWAALAACLLVYQLGAILDLPQWVMNISPFTHTPAVPATDIKLLPLAIQSAVAAGLLGLGLTLFRRRDLTNG
jgi:ABC-2 type transport system permease protein